MFRKPLLWPSSISAAEGIGVKGSSRKVVRGPAASLALITNIASLTSPRQQIGCELPVVSKGVLTMPDIGQRPFAHIAFDEDIGVERTTSLDISYAVDKYA